VNVSCILITKEKEYPQEVLRSLPFDDVIIERECPSVYRRYELALQAKHTVIYVQDDDCVIDVHRLLRSYDGRLTNAITEHHLNAYFGTGMTLVGFGTMFPKSMIDFSPYIERYGVDPLLLSQADRVFTYLNQPHNSIVMPIRNLPTAIAPDRMSTQGDHWVNLQLIQRRCAALGRM
jgi:hypothetical protein